MAITCTSHWPAGERLERESRHRQSHAAAAETRPAPNAARPSARETYPFCSTRCKDVDLNRWLSGSYAIPIREDEDGGGEGSPGHEPE